MNDPTKGGASAAAVAEPEPGAALNPAVNEPGQEARGGAEETDTEISELQGLAEGAGVGDLVNFKPDGDGAGGEKDPDPARSTDGEPGADDDESQPIDKIKGIGPELAAKIQRRIDKIHARGKEAEKAAVARAEKAEAELARRGTSEPAELPRGASPIHMAETEAELETLDAKLKQQEDVLFENLDGYESEDGQTTFSAKEVRARHREVQRLRQEELPRARERVRQRAKVDQILVREHYPELLDAKSEASQARERILKSFPGLKSHPFVNVIIGQLLAGEKALREKIAAKGKKPDERTPAPPRVPSEPAPSRREPAAPKKTVTASSNRVNKFIEGGGTEAALAEAIDGLETTDDN
jgi:hypothetical protein